MSPKKKRPLAAAVILGDGGGGVHHTAGLSCFSIVELPPKLPLVLFSSAESNSGQDRDLLPVLDPTFLGKWPRLRFREVAVKTTLSRIRPNGPLFMFEPERSPGGEESGRSDAR
jgi:hypothetical protein